MRPTSSGRPATVPSPDDSRSTARLGDYLRRLREGYGYTLRKVEERSAALGEPIDNSQLSRFEKGKAVPSFDKLRALARVFNVSIQHFSDALDLEDLVAFKPRGGDYDALMRDGDRLFEVGEYGRAFATYERAVEIARRASAADVPHEGVAEARRRMAAALKRLGKLEMAEQELREILKRRRGLGPRTRLRTLLQLGFLYRERGDLYIASVLAREALALAVAEGDRASQAAVRNALGNILHDEGEPDAARREYEAALEILDGLEASEEMACRLRINLGGCLVAAGRLDEGEARLSEALERARAGGFRRDAALALTRLAEASLARGDRERGKTLLAESDALASRAPGAYHDILFLNAFRRWELAREDGNGTREKIAFGRLRHLRSMLERRFPEVDAFDRHVEAVRRSYDH